MKLKTSSSETKNGSFYLFAYCFFVYLFLSFSNQKLFSEKDGIYLHVAIFFININKLNVQNSVNSSGTNMIT